MPERGRQKQESPRAKCEFIAGFGVVQIKEFKICGLSEFSRGQKEENARTQAKG